MLKADEVIPFHEQCKKELIEMIHGENHPFDEQIVMKYIISVMNKVNLEKELLGSSQVGKASVSEADKQRFESFLPSQNHENT